MLVVEPKFVGHHLGWASEVAVSLTGANTDVVLAVSAEALGTAQAGVKLASGEAVEVRALLEAPPAYTWRSAAPVETAGLMNAIEEVDPDHVVVPSADNLIFGLAQSRSARRRLRAVGSVDLVLHHCRQAYPRRRARDVRRQGYRLLVEMVRPARILTPDPFAAARRGGHLGVVRRVQYLPHPIIPPPAVSRAEARRALGLDPDIPIVLLAGDLKVFERKAGPLLLEAARRVAEATPLMVAIHGECRLSVSEIEALASPAIVDVRNEFLSEEDFGLAFCAADVVWSCLPDHCGISSTLLYAAAAATPAVTIDWGCQGYLARRLGGAALTTLDPDAAAAAITAALRTRREVPSELNDLVDRAQFASVLAAPFRTSDGSGPR